MTIQEAIHEALNRPIKDLGKFIIERKGQRGTCGAMFLVTDEEGELAVRDWESNTGSVAKLFLEDILADDWIVEKYEETP